MNYNYLGNTKLLVSHLGFGTLTMSKLQKSSDEKTIHNVNTAVIEGGINFYDTAEQYDNYDIINDALKIKNDIIISSKSYAFDRSGAKASLDKCLNSIGRNYIDIFSMHEQINKFSIDGHMEALEYYKEQKKAGLIKAIGISTHYISGVIDVRNYVDIDVIHPIFNKAGMGIVDGNALEMEKNLEITHSFGKGIFSMKALAGGNLIKNNIEALEFVKNKSFIDSVVLGMQSVEEVLANIKLFNNNADFDSMKILQNNTRRIHIDEDCKMCYECIKKCHQNALSVVDGKIVVDKSKCVLCNYCGSVCKNFCIKVI